MVFIATPVELTGFVHYLPYIFRPRAFIGRCLQIKVTMQRTATCTAREIDFCSGINGVLSKREGETLRTVYAKRKQRGGEGNGTVVESQIRFDRLKFNFVLISRN